MQLLRDTFDFFAEIVRSAGRAGILFWAAVVRIGWVLRPRTLKKVVRQEFICGVASIPVVTITALFSGMVIAGQTGYELKRFGLVQTLGSIVGVAMCREMGPVLTAIVVAGFVGGGMASVLGTMKVNEEIDALDVMGIDPVRYLIVPRLAAMFIAAPALTVYADIVGIMGGAMVSKYQLDLPYDVFKSWMLETLRVQDITFGILKGFVFGTIITMVACEQGFSTRGGAEGVGRATMRSVVYSFLMILVANYVLFSLIYKPFFT
ncbi:MAG: ABC transporter permease [Planctomycetes bacterium]|nr:ABC transporter permease [Planctomycetota bacterium]